jgi:hypothetical protein
VIDSAPAIEENETVSETTVQATVYAGLSQPFASAGAFLLGPEGQLWDLYPRLGYGPRLLAYGDTGTLLGGDGRSASEPPHAATPPWMPSIAGKGATVNFMISHSAHYLTFRACDFRNGRLADGLATPSFKDARMTLESADGLIRLRFQDNPKTFIFLKDGKWSLGPGGPYLLLAPRAANIDALLSFASDFALPGPQGLVGVAPWEQVHPIGPRARLSPLANPLRLVA